MDDLDSAFANNAADQRAASQNAINKALQREIADLKLQLAETAEKYESAFAASSSDLATARKQIADLQKSSVKRAALASAFGAFAANLADS